jgi:hypothetical protein
MEKDIFYTQRRNDLASHQPRNKYETVLLQICSFPMVRVTNQDESEQPYGHFHPQPPRGDPIARKAFDQLRHAGSELTSTNDTLERLTRSIS